MFKEKLEKLKEMALARTVLDGEAGARLKRAARTVVGGRELINFASNDYLGLSAHPALIEAASMATRDFGAGAGASRLLSGGSPLHRELDLRTAAFKGVERSLLMGTGFMANTGAIPALAGEGDAVFSDELNHASIIDGCRLSRATLRIYRHRDTAHLKELLEETPADRRLVVTDGVFSMDGDIAPLKELYALCREYNAILYVDDAHGTGVTGSGRGTLKHHGLGPSPDIIEMGTYSKALGSFGAYIAATAEVVEYLLSTARSFIFSTALPPATVAASMAALDVLSENPDIVKKLWRNREQLASALLSMGLGIGGSETPIIPVMLDDARGALKISERLMEDGIYAPAIRPPTVKRPRLRLTVSAAHSEEDIELLVQAIGRAINTK